MYGNVCNKYRKLNKTKMSYLWEKIGLSIIYNKRGHEYEQRFNEEKLTEILKIFGVINKIDERQKIYNHIRKKT